MKKLVAGLLGVLSFWNVFALDFPKDTLQGREVAGLKKEEIDAYKREVEMTNFNKGIDKLAEISDREKLTSINPTSQLVSLSKANREISKPLILAAKHNSLKVSSETL